MCGIAGTFLYNRTAGSVDIAELTAMRDHMAARGPDGKNNWISQNGIAGLAHRRLSIIDLSHSGAQPMLSADARLAITFNGEIYNYKQLRRQLEEHGYVFRSQSDTEVLLHLYAHKGEDMLRHLRGMFAFGLWDDDKQTMLLARDPYGIKPLYYSDNGRTIRFASQVKALLASGAISTTPDPAGWSSFFLFGSVSEPFTTYREIRAVPAGSLIKITRNGTAGIKRYHSISEAYRQGECDTRLIDLDAAALQRTVRAAVLDSVQHHLVADVPVGAFLSGGIDSGTLVGLIHDAGHTALQTITLAFEDFSGSSNDETLIANDVARTYNTRHTVRVITEKEFQDDLPRFIKAMDQPTIDGINTWFVSKAAKELGLKVAISGLGGDELFGGYPSFTTLPRIVCTFKAFNKMPALGTAVRKIMSGINPSRLGLSPKVAGLAELGGSYPGAYLLRRGLFMPWELDRIMEPEQLQEARQLFCPMKSIEATITPPPDLAYHAISAMESSLYMKNQLLRDTDWTSMAHSVEVRTPLVDAFLLDRLAPLGKGMSTRRNKELLRNCPNTALPISVDRPKIGFTVPMTKWMKQLNTPAMEAIASNAPTSSHWSRRWALAVQALFEDGEAKL